MDESDIQQLRDAGFSNAGILDIAHVTGYYAYVNRLQMACVNLESVLERKK